MVKRNNTQILSILRHNKISVYKFVKEMGFDPVKDLSRWILRMDGTFMLSAFEKDLMLNTLERLTGNSGIDMALVRPDKYRAL